MLTELKDLGLSDKEARVYLAALEIGRSTADKLAKHAKIARPTTYLQIDSLIEKGLMSTYEEGKKTYFAAESPELLRRLLNRQKDSLDAKERDLAKFLPELLRQFESAGERPIVRFFPGKEGLAIAREEALLSKDKRFYGIFSPENLSRVYGQEYTENYSNRRKALGIHSKGIYTSYKNIDRAVLDELTERRYFDLGVLPLSIDIYIFDSKVEIVSLEGVLFGLIIESDQLSKSFRAIFNFLWDQAKDLPK